MRVDERTKARKGKAMAAAIAEDPVEHARRRLRSAERSEREFNALMAEAAGGIGDPAGRAEDDLINYLEAWDLDRAVKDLEYIERAAIFLCDVPPTTAQVEQLWMLDETLRLVKGIRDVSLGENAEGRAISSGKRRRRGQVDPRHEAEEELIEFYQGQDYYPVVHALKTAERRAMDQQKGASDGLRAAIILFQGYQDRLERLAFHRT